MLDYWVNRLKREAPWPILCLTLRTTVTSPRILEEDACHRARNLCVFSHVQKGTPGLTHKGCVLQHVSLGRAQWRHGRYRDETKYSGRALSFGAEGPWMENWTRARWHCSPYSPSSEWVPNSKEFGKVKWWEERRLEPPTTHMPSPRYNESLQSLTLRPAGYGTFTFLGQFFVLNG